MTVDMTRGAIPQHLARFSVPLILSNLFQLSYNAADSIIVGRFAGDGAQASIGTANPLMNVLLFFIIGICTGAGVLLSESFGAKDDATFRTQLCTTVTAGCAFTLLLSVLFAVLAYPLLWCIRVPPEILDMAAGYLMLVSGSLVFSFLYNCYATALRSVGDAKTPLVFVIISTLFNVALDCLLVIRFRMGVLGAGAATLCAQALCAALCMAYVRARMPQLWVSPRALRIDRIQLKTIVHYAWATGMQKVALMVGKVLIQACVNPLGVAAIAAFNAVNRVDDFVFEPEQSIGAAITTFTAQNRGAKQRGRIGKAFRCGMLMELGYWLFIGTVIWLAAPALMALFTGHAETEAALLGVRYLRAMAFFYAFPAMTNGLQGYVRGCGRMKVCLLATSVQMLGRVTSSYLLVPQLGIAGVAYGCCVGWIVMLLYEVPYTLHNLRPAQIE